jgi:hypothetical protein
MTLQVAVIGIDGSGKSTLARALPLVLSAECGVVAGGAGDELWVFGPDEDHMAPGFEPRGIPLAARIARACRLLAKRCTNDPRIYPYVKLAHLMFQDDAAASIAHRYACDVMVSDCNLVLSAMGRGSNYRRGRATERSRVEDLQRVFELLIDGRPLPEESAQRLPALDAAAAVARLARILGFDGVWLPDVVIFLDVDPEVALRRMTAGSRARDRHENLADMTRARESYLKALDALRAYRPSTSVHVIEASDLSSREVIELAVDVVRPQLRSRSQGQTGKVLGTPAGETARRAMSAGYLFRYLLPRLFAGAWREPFFLLSRMGRMLLREGYSAGVMKEIYDADGSRPGLFARVFLEYPLHRAVHDRLEILTDNIEPELTWRLEQHERVRIFTAPSGFAYDVFRPLESIASSRPELMRRVEMVAADLDPHDALASRLRRRAQDLGIDFHFLTGDLTDPKMQAHIADFGPFDVALFVGLSSWLPRGEAIRHLGHLASNLRRDGLLFTDCFSPAAYSAGGRQLGYRAHYHSPELYRVVLDRCGFDGAVAEVESGRDRINHVLIAEPLRPSARGHAPGAGAGAGTVSGMPSDSMKPAAGSTSGARLAAVRVTVATPAASASTAEAMNSVAGPRVS